MWLSDQALRRLSKLTSATVFAVAIAGCSFTPLYGTNSGTTDKPLSYAAPQNRAEQLVYRELALSLGQTTDQTAPRAKVTTSSSTRQVGRSSTGLPTTTRELSITATAEITSPDPVDPGTLTTLYQGTKIASATYTTNGQRLADQEAKLDAEKRAAIAVAQSLRLSIKAALAKTQ